MDMEGMKHKLAKLALLFPEEKRPLLMQSVQQILSRLGKDIRAINNPECIQYANNKFQWKETDIILCSFPKTGTNWMGNILNKAIFADEPDVLDLHSNMPVLFGLEAGEPSKFELMDSVPGKHRFFVTHQNGTILDRKRLKESKVKVIYVLRNPKDQMVSQFNFFQKQPMFGQHPEMKHWFDSFDAFFPHALEGDFHIDGLYPPAKSTYIDHIFSWLPEADDDHILFVYFEDLKKDFLGELQKIIDFLKISLSEEKKKEISEKTSIESMRKEYAQKNLPDGLINKGGVGGWRDVFSDEQSKQVDAVFQKLAGTGVEFQFSL